MAMQVKFPFGKLVSVFVTHVEETSGDFFVQINSEAGNLDALMTEIEQNVLSGKARPPKAAEIMVGCIYLAQFQEDSRWYRARVLGVNEMEQCEVVFVDYGNTDFVPLSCIRNAEEKFCELAPQSFQCELDGINRFRGQSFDETVALLNETIVEQELFCKAVQLKKNCVVVTQLFFDEKGNKSVFDEMQSGGVSAATDSVMSNGESAAIPRQTNRGKEVKYETINLPPDSFHDLTVTWVEDPSHFWCQLLSNLTTVAALMENLAEVYTNLGLAELPLQSCTVGYPCCAKFYEDETWYRAIITNVSSIATGRIEVRFVDYGNSQDTELSDVRDLKDEFLKDPCQAMYFAITGVDPASKDGLWADEAKVLFEKLINYKHVVGLVTRVENDGRHRVKLMDTTADLDMELNQILIAAGYGVKSDETPTTTTSTATTLKSSQPATKTTSQPVFAKENVQVGIEEKVLITNIITPSKFYCQLFKNGPKLEILMQEVASHYCKLGANEELLSAPSPGDPCCAQFSEDGCWYRAVVMNTSSRGVAVQYIDYGNSETLPLNKIKKLIPKFSDLPQQGIECTLNRIKPKFVAGEPKWNPRDTEKFRDLALEKEGKLTVVTQDSSGVCRAELVVRNRREDQNVSEQLLISGNAELADGALPASENYESLKSQMFPEPDLKVGHFEDVIVSYTEHPCNFWCQLQKSATQLDSLMTEIHEAYSSEGQRNTISNPACGMLCCAQFTEDNKWYRGKITGVKKGGLVEVHFVDYGNYEMLPLSRVKKLQAEFLKLPPQAVKCALAKISPSNKDLLSDDVMNRFEELTLDKELVMMADKYDEVSGTFAVVLLDTTEGKNLDIASDLQTIMGPCSSREKAHIVVAQIQPGTTERVFVSSASRPEKFFCQLLKTAAFLDELMIEMFEYYEQLSAQQEQMSEPSVGEFCAAKFTLDDGWYRAKVLKVQGNDISVFYIDYGNSETLSLSRLKILNSKFQSLASQAIECSLSGGVKGVSDDKFLELVSEKEFTAKVVNVNAGVAVVDLVSKDTNQSVCNILCKDGTPSPSCSITQLQWKTGDVIDVFIPFAESAQKFFCQASAHSSELDDLMNRLEENYSASTENVSSLQPGSICVAWYDGWYRAKVEQVQGKDVTVNFIDYGDTATISLDNIRTFKPDFSSLPAQAVQCCLKGFSANQGPENFKDLVVEQEFKAKVISAKSGDVYEVDLVPRDGSASVSQTLSKEVDASPTSLTVASIQLKTGDKVDVFIPFVESAQKFFCQVSENSSNLDDLMNRLEEHYSSDQGTVSSISVGTFCVARYEDGGWYRAQVTGVQGQSIDVFYIDYGDTATIPLSSIRSLKPESSTLPAQAVKCCLKGYPPNQGPENFKDLVIEQEFSAQVTSVKAGAYEVELASKDGSSLFSSELPNEVETTGELSCSVDSIQLKPGDKVNVFIPFVEGAQKFFCQVSENSSNLDDLMNRLEEHYSSDQGAVTSISVGTFCVARYEDGGWYRAQVTAFQGESIDVFYIDYGDTATIPLSSIRSLKPVFSTLPAQAVKCYLKGYSSNQGPENFKELVIEQEFSAQVTSLKASAYEVELASKDGSSLFSSELPKEVETTGELSCSVDSIQLKPGDKVNVFIPFVEGAQKFFCQVSENSSNLDDLMNRLEEHYSSDQGTVTSISVGTFCVARYEDGGWYRAQVTGVQGQSIDVFYIDYGDTATLPLSSIRSLKPEFSSLPAQAVKCCWKGYSLDQGPENFKDLVIEQEFSAQVTIVKSKNFYGVELIAKDGSSLISETLSKDMKTTGQPPSSVASIQLKPGDKVDVFIPFVESAQKFFCQVSQNSSDLDDLMIKLEEHYSSDQEIVTSVVAGSFCVAQYEDGGWYRSQVSRVEGESIDLFYIDYGDTATLPLGNIRPLKPEFSLLPAQAINCCLKGCSTNQQPENFKDLAVEQEFELQVIGNKQPNVYEVELISKEGSKLFGETLPSEGENKEIGPTLVSGISVGSFVQLCPTTCVSPHQFHCQIATADHKEKLSQLMDQLQEYYEAIGDEEQGITSPEVGMNCAAFFADDGLWYRGRITKVMYSQHVEVCYIDFGNCETVPVGKVKAIKEELLQVPAQAIRCSLASISPASDIEWPDDAVERFKDLTMQKQLVGEVIKIGNDDTLDIELFDTTDESVDKNIGELLIQEGLACHGTSKPASAVKPYAALGKAKLAENEKVYITAVESPGSFFCQISGTEEKLNSLMSEISAVYDSLSNEELVVNSINVGDVCCAQFSDDNQWYRAVVEDNTDNALTVRFLDYGNAETLPISRTKILTDAFFSEPPLAIKCNLSCVQPSAGGAWPDEAGSLFEELTLEKELDAKFISLAEPFEVQLSDNSVNIGEELVKAKLALTTKSASEPTAPSKPASGGYTKPVVECGTMYDAVITHVSSPGKFYCQLVNMKEQLDGMMTDVNDHYFQLAETEGCLVSPTVGQPCVALFEEMWYRAEVVNISVNDMTVHYVDYGNDETLIPSQVKQITRFFLKTPKVAIECSLDLNRDLWLKGTTDMFEELIANDEKLIVKIVRCQGGKYEVKVFSDDARCFSAEVLSSIPGAAQEAVTLKEQALQIGQTEDVYIVHTVSPQDFYVQLSVTYPKLEQMMAKIAEVYSGLADDVGPEDLVIGNPICAQFSEDNCWYRGVVRSVPSDFEVEVHYVDYGNSEVVLLSDVRQLSRRLFDLPVQAVRCCLDSPDVELFEQRVAYKELKATFLSLEKGKWKVSLLDENGKIGQVDVADDLDDEFKGEFIQPSIFPEMKEHVYVSHVVSPDEFYVQFESALDYLSALSAEISQFYIYLQPSANVLRRPSPGMSCCAKFSQDGDWYRGKIKRVISTGAEVEFVDYGNCEIVHLSQVKDPEKRFMQLPQQAILCGLDATKDQWSTEEVNIFKSVALDKSFNAKFIIRDGQKWRVSLDMGGVSVVDMFMTKDASDFQQEGKDISNVQVGSYAVPQLSSGQIEEVSVSYVTASGDFYVQLSKTSSDLAIIDIHISDIYDLASATTEAMEMCFVDSLCCARFSEDLKWYRALITKVFSDAEVEVLFVDYGNTDSVRVTSLKQLKPELLKFPVQAVKCRLEGSKDIWTESDVEQFESNVWGRPLHVTFTRQEGTTWFVTIQELDMFSSKAKLTTKVKAFSKESLDLSKREEAYFLFADSPDCFWLHLVRTGDGLVELMDQIAAEVTTDQPLEKSHVTVGRPCLGKYTENDMWHRAQIVDIQDDVNVTVSYIDYGNSETLPLERLHPISDSHCKLPAQAIHCRLADVQGVDPNRITNYLNEMLLEKVVEVEVQNQHSDGSYTVKLFDPGESQSINDQIVGECLGDTSLVEEAKLELASPSRLAAMEDRVAFKLPELQPGSKVPVSFVSAFLPAEMQLLLTEGIEERDQLTEHITAMYKALDENELKLENPEVGMLCCVHFSEKWFRGEIISISADDTAAVKLVDCGTHEKIPISELKLLKEELIQTPVFVLESSLANIHPSSEDGQWSPECSNILESLCRSKALVAEITQVFGDVVELILNDDSGKQINQRLVDLGYAKACDIQEDFSGEQLSLKWPELQIGQCLDVYLMAVKDLGSIQLQLDDHEAGLSRMMEQLSTLYSSLGETEEVVGNPRVGQVCCAQFAEDHDWYRAVVTCVSAAGVEVKFVDYGNIDVALMIKQLREEFFLLPVQCVDCSLHGVVSASEKSEEEIAAMLTELCESKQLKAEITNVSGDSVVVNLFDESGETRESVADALMKLGFAEPRPSRQEEPRRISISEEGKMVYNYPESGDDSVYNVSLTSTSSPSDFWCQLVESSSELKSLSEKVDLFYQSLGENDFRFLCLQVGDICCAQFTDDNKWHRSQVNKVCSDGQVCVHSVDCVKLETLTLDRIKKLDPGFAVLPVQALYCSLAGIEPPHKYYEEDWSSDAVGRFQELCQGKDFKIKIKRTVGDVTFVDLLDSAGLSITNQLLSEGLAVEIKSPLTLSPVKDAQKQQECLSTEEAEEVDKDSSDENVFVEAESGIEGVELLATDTEGPEIEELKGEEDEDDDDEEEEFLDSNDQLSDDITEISVGHEGVKEEGTLKQSEEKEEQAVKDEEKKESMDGLQAAEEQEQAVESDEKEEGEKGLQATEHEQEQAAGEDEKKQEEGDGGPQATEEQQEQTLEDNKTKEDEGKNGHPAAAEKEEQDLESDEKEEGEKGLQATEHEQEQAAGEDEKKQEEGDGGPQETEEQQEQTLEDSKTKEDAGKNGHPAAAEKEEQDLESDEKKQGVDGNQAAEEQEDAKESDEGKQEEGVNRHQATEEQQEQTLEDNKTREDAGKNGHPAAAEKGEQDLESGEKKQGVDGNQAAEEQEDAKESDEGKQEEGVNRRQPTEEQEETVESDEKKQGGEDGLVQTTEEEKAEEVSSPVSEEGLKEVDEEEMKVMAKELQSCEPNEQVLHGEVKEEETEAQIGETDVSGEFESQAEEQANSADTSETGGEPEKTGEKEDKSEEPKMEEGLATVGEKDGGVDEPDNEFVQANDVVTEAFSEEDLSAITGSANEAVEATAEEEKCEEERLKEDVEQISEVEESAKVFLEELLSNICGSVDKQKSEQEETVKECDAEDLSKSPIAAEQPTNNNSDAACCDDDDDVLSDEALEKLDKELEAASSEENKLGITSICPVVNGTGEPVLENGQDKEEQTSIASCRDDKLSVESGNAEVGNNLTTEESF